MGDIIDFEIFDYESFCVYEALNKDKRNKNIKLKRYADIPGMLLSPDLYAPDGIPSLGLTGETLIEIKKYISFATSNELEAYFDSLGSHYNILVVYFKDSEIIPSFEKDGYKKFLCKSISEFKGQKKIVNDPERYYSDKAKKTDWHKERARIIERAQVCVSTRNNVLFLGAGVSMSANVPSWNDLLKGLMGEVKQLSEPALNAFKELNTHVLDECGDSYLVMARYLQTAIGLYDDKLLFPKLIQQYLYNGNITSPLLTHLSRIIQQRKVSEVITYNFDDILEQNLAKIGMKVSVDYTSVSKDAEIKDHNNMPIYHVHGIIPENGEPSEVVFSEEVYHKRYANAFHWSNIEQLHALSRMHCFFIGLSMTDPNLRRLIDASNEINEPNGDRHFAFLPRKQMDRYCLSKIDKGCKYVHVSESLIDKKLQKSIYDLNYTVFENIFRKLGVDVIWYEDPINELPSLVAQVFGLSKYESLDSLELIKQCENEIKAIKVIEDRVPPFNPVSLTPFEIFESMRYVNTHSEEYKKRVHDAGDMLDELSKRIEIHSQDDINKLKTQVPKLSESLTGFANFFQCWLDTIKKLISKK